MDERRILSLLSILAPLIPLFLADLLSGDYKLFTSINQGLSSPALDFTCIYLAPTLFAVSYTLALAVLCISKDEDDVFHGAFSLVNGSLSYGVGSMIKVLVRRPRPFQILDGVRVIGLWHASTYSFPSTTTMLVFGLTLPILFRKPRHGFILTALSYLIGFSLVYTGYHFPSDVIAGVLLSVPIATFTVEVGRYVKNLLGKFKVG
ncbi:phosphatase PAP2 family protein [Candidatus Bathyarchaeota archaeon]|nr:phosphatase PAP2 family protein [Candidatus Bathyarchaeota archaeon]